MIHLWKLMDLNILKGLSKAVMTQWEKDGLPDDFDPNVKSIYEFFIAASDPKENTYSESRVGVFDHELNND